METDCDSLSNDSATNFRSRSNTLPAKLLQASAIAAADAKTILVPSSRASNVHSTLLAQTLLHNVKAELLLHSGTSGCSNGPNSGVVMHYGAPQQCLAETHTVHVPEAGVMPPQNGSLTNLHASAASTRPVKAVITADRGLALGGCAQFGEAQAQLHNPHTLRYPSGPAGYATQPNVLNGASEGYVGPTNGAVPAHADRSPAACLPVVYDESTAMCESDSYMANNEPPGVVRSGAGPTKMKPARRNAWGNASYADLITQAIESSPEKRLTLSQIYDWMVRNVDYFKDKGEQNSSAGWKNSIRHNLSLHARFVRVQNEQTGKISYWTVNYEAIRRERDSVASGASTPRGSGRRRAATLDAAEYDKTRTKLRRRPDASAKLQRTAALLAEQQLEAGLLSYDSSDSQPFGSPQQTPLNRFDSLTFDAAPTTSGIQPLLAGPGCHTLLSGVDVHGQLLHGVNGHLLGGTVVQPIPFVSTPHRRDPASPSTVLIGAHPGSNVASPLSLLRSGHVIDEERRDNDPNRDDAVANEEALWQSMRIELANAPRMHSTSSASISVASPAQHSPLSTVPPNFASARSTPLQSVSATTAQSPLLSSAHSTNGIPSLAAQIPTHQALQSSTITLARPGSHGSLVATETPSRFAQPHSHLHAYQTPAANAYITYGSPNAHVAYSTAQYAFAPSGTVSPAHTAVNSLATQRTTVSPNARLHTNYSPAHSQNPSPQRTPNCESPVQAICSAARSFLTLDAGPRPSGLADNNPHSNPTADSNLDGLVLVGDAGTACLYALPVAGGATLGVSDFQTVQFNGSNPDGFRVLFDSGPPAAQRCVPQTASSEFAARRYGLSDLQHDLPAQPSPVLRAALMGCTNTPLQFTFAANESSCVAGNQPPSACATSFVYAASNMRIDNGNTANVQFLTDSNGSRFAATELPLNGLAVVDGDTGMRTSAHAPTMLKAPVPLGPRSSVDAIEPSLPFALSSSSIPLPSSTASEMHFF